MPVLRNRVATSAMNFYKFIFTQTSAKMTRAERSREETSRLSRRLSKVTLGIDGDGDKGSRRAKKIQFLLHCKRLGS